MHVDVHLPRIEIDEQHDGRTAVFGVPPRIGFAQGIADGGGRGRSSVGEHELFAAHVEVAVGTLHVAIHVHVRVGRVHGHERFGERGAKEVANALLERGVRREAVDFASVDRKREADVGMGEGVYGEHGTDVGLFRCVGAQKLPPGRHVAEEVAHFDDRSGRRAAAFHLGQRAGVDHETRAFLVRGAPRGEREARDAGDGRDGLAAKA